VHLAVRARPFVPVGGPSGAVVGGVAGFAGNKTDFFLMRFVDLMISVPQFFVPNVFSFATEGKDLRYGTLGMPG